MLSFHRVRSLNQKHRSLVNGYIREKENKLNLAPTPLRISSLCILFSYSVDSFDPARLGDCMFISDNCTQINKKAENEDCNQWRTVVFNNPLNCINTKWCVKICIVENERYLWRFGYIKASNIDDFNLQRALGEGSNAEISVAICSDRSKRLAITDNSGIPRSFGVKRMPLAGDEYEFMFNCSLHSIEVFHNNQKLAESVVEADFSFDCVYPAVSLFTEGVKIKIISLLCK